MTTKDKILSRSARLFQTKGYAATSMREIAGEVGIEAASLYNHIDSKAQLLEAMCFQIADRFTNEIDTIAKEEISSLEKIERILGFHIDLALEDAKVMTVFNQEWRHLSGTKRKALQDLRHTYEEEIQQIILTGQEAGEIDPSVDPETTVKLLLSSVHWVYFLKSSSIKERTSRIKKNIKQLINKGLTA